MCGFAGFLGHPDRSLLERMGERVRQRGPDQQGEWESAECSLTHKRLAIIDLSDGGRQPMVSQDGRCVIAYNGEIYNYRALRQAYEAEGWKFRTQTDTECLIASFVLHGLRDLKQFHGIFAFALWDMKEKRLFIARDRMGIKPLYVATSTDGRVGVGSEVGALLPLRETWKLDSVARAMYLTVGYVSGPRTMWQGIESLAPGKLFLLDAGGKLHEQFSFEKLDVERVSETWREKTARLSEVVDGAVAAQLVSDRPVGVFLSGGLDSSVVVSAMRRARPGGTIKTFTTRFRHHVADAKFNRDADLAKRTAERYRCEHFEIEIGPEDVIREAQAVARSLGQPHSNHSVVAMDAVARLASAEVPVVLSGDGGDEFFAGYERYRLYSLVAGLLRRPLVRSVARRALAWHPRSQAWGDLVRAASEAERLLTFHAAPSGLRHELYGSAFNDGAVINLWNELLAQVTTFDPVNRFMALDRATWLRDDAFARGDRLTMRHGVELRVPLTDDAVAAFASRLPSKDHVSRFETKRLWRETFAGRCMPEVINEPKRAWFPPTAKWLRVGLTDWTRDLLEEAIVTHTWLNGDAVRLAFEDHLASRAYHLNELWTIVSYQLWWREYGSTLHDV